MVANEAPVTQTELNRSFDVLAFGAHPDDLEVVIGGTIVKLVRKGLSVLFVDLCEESPHDMLRGESAMLKHRKQRRFLESNALH